MSKRRPAWVPPLVSAGGLLAVWYVISYGVLDSKRRFLLPAPHQVVGDGILDPGDGVFSANLADSLRATLQTGIVALVGLALAVLIGGLIAVVMSQSSFAEGALYPVAVVVQVIPILALVPLIGFWFGFDFWSRVIACVLVAIFPVIANFFFGLREVDPGLDDVFFLHGATRWQRLIKLQLPGALPAIFTGLRVAAGASVIGAIVGDFFFRRGPAGIGRLIDNYSKQLQTADLFVAIVLSAIVGLLFFAAIGWLDRSLTGGPGYPKSKSSQRGA